ncbi:MAG: hypothetical protein GKR91_09365 [Pseudomonadales bacterium]|nr:hypothetical protein [Pseudomonadales bacterium]
MFIKEKIPNEIREKYKYKSLLRTWLFDQEHKAGFLRVGGFGVGSPFPGGAQNFEYNLIWNNQLVKIITKELSKPSESSPTTNRLYIVSHELRPIEAPKCLESHAGDLIELTRSAFLDYGFAGSKEKSESVTVQFNRNRPIFFT